MNLIWSCLSQNSSSTTTTTHWSNAHPPSFVKQLSSTVQTPRVYFPHGAVSRTTTNSSSQCWARPSTIASRWAQNSQLVKHRLSRTTMNQNGDMSNQCHHDESIRRSCSYVKQWKWCMFSCHCCLSWTWRILRMCSGMLALSCNVTPLVHCWV